MALLNNEKSCPFNFVRIQGDNSKLQLKQHKRFLIAVLGLTILNFAIQNMFVL